MFRRSSTLALAGLLFCSALAQNPISKVYGIDFSPYLNGQDPNLGSQVTASQITARLQIIAPYTKWIRTFSSTNGLENIPSIARQFGLKVAANAWISKDTAQNALEINNLITNANAGVVDIAIVGSEAILRNDVTEAQLLVYMNQVRQAIPADIPVTTADVWGTFIDHPNLIAASGVVLANFYPYWEKTSIDNAVCSLMQEYQRLVAASGSRPVVVSETGWPSAGTAQGSAVPSVANANLFALQYLTWAAANNIPSFYFEAFDEAWKANTSEGPQGAHWGIWDTTGVIKPGMDAFFNGRTASVNCNGTIPGPTALQFIYVPPYGSGDALEVQVTGVQPLSYVLATYIKVAGNWWTKPSFAQPAVAINPDGTARIPIDTGGIDQLATDIAVFMIPAGTVPPVVGPGPLPAVTNAITSLQVSRTQSSISGTILDSQSNPIAGAVISDTVLGSAKSAPDGKYSFYNIAVFGTATLTVTDASYSFPQSPATVNIPAGNLTVNFTGISLPVVTATHLANGTTGVPYLSPLNATGGAPPYGNWAVAIGALPAGLSLNSATGVISGTPTSVSGSPFQFSVTVTDSAGKTSAAQALSISVLFGISYKVGDVAPFSADTAPNFGDGAMNILDLVQVLFAVNNVPGFRPTACSDRFDAMDLHPVDVGSTRGGDGVLDIRDLIRELFRVNNLDPDRPVRASRGGVCGGGASSMTARLSEAAGRSVPFLSRTGSEVHGALVLGEAENTSENEERIPVYLEARRNLVRVAVTFALGDQRSQLRFVSTAATPPSLAEDSQSGVVAVAWLEGVTVRAGGRLLLGYVVGSTGASANLKVYGISASRLGDDGEVHLDAPTLTEMQR